MNTRLPTTPNANFIGAYTDAVAFTSASHTGRSAATTPWMKRRPIRRLESWDDTSCEYAVLSCCDVRLEQDAVDLLCLFLYNNHAACYDSNRIDMRTYMGTLVFPIVCAPPSPYKPHG